jgi:hypothetical protein
MSFAINLIRPEPAYRRNAFEAGLKSLGYTFAPGGVPNDERDLLVVWNVKAGADEARCTQWEKSGGTVIVAENGYLSKTPKTRYAISVHGHNGSGWFPQGTEDRFSALGFELKPQRTRGTYVLVCGQRGVGSARMASPPQWGEKTAAALRKAGEVRFRPHPGNNAPKVPLAADLANASRCVIWSSAAGVEALAEGVPVEHHAPHWICEGHRAIGREMALQRMAHGQWDVAEITSGEPFARILNNLKDAEWG